jgi:uncharacterized membrane protein
MSRSGPILTALAIAYPVVSHLGMAFDIPALGLFWLGLVLGFGFLLGTRSPVLLSLSLLCLGAALVGHLLGNAEALLRVPPVVIALSVAWVFGRTLLPGRTALISQIGERVRGELPAPVARYGHRLTWVWFVLMCLIAIECILLGLLAPPFWWSLFTNFINYALIALLFVVEYPIRRHILRDLEHSPFIESVRGSWHLSQH